MPALLIINYSIDDPDTFGDYQAAAGPALKIGSECELVAIDATSDRMEGETSGHQTVVLKFADKAKAREIYESADYQAILGTRFAATSDHWAVLVDSLS